jgi:DNA-binding transcriptional regulator GbsR (MarR family)
MLLEGMETSDEPGAASERLTRSVLQVCDAVGAFIEYWGFKAVHGRVWALLALRQGAMSQVEIADLLGVSRSLISGTMSELVEKGLVRAVDERRGAPYVASMDVWPIIKDVLRGREWMLLESTRLALEAAIEEMEVAQAEGSQPPYELGRMRLLLSMTELSQALLRMLFAIGVPRSVEGLGEWVQRASKLIGSFRNAR